MMSEIDFKSFDTKQFKRTEVFSTSLEEYFNSITLESHNEIKPVNIGSSSVHRFPLPATWGNGNSSFLQINAQGVFGIDIPDLLPKKNSNYKYEYPYYYNSIEPDYQFLYTFQMGSSSILKDIVVKYNNYKIIIKSTLNNTETTSDIMIVLEINNINNQITVGNCFFEVLSTVQDYIIHGPLMFGFKDYNRINDDWSPYKYKNELIVGKASQFLAEPDFIIYPGTAQKYGYNNYVNSKEIVINTNINYTYNKIKNDEYLYNKNVKAYNEIINPLHVLDFKNISTSKPDRIFLPYTFNPNNNYYKEYNYSIFVEGKIGDQIINVKNNNYNEERRYTLINNAPNNSLYEQSSVYIARSGDMYYKKFKPSKTKIMIPGELSGIVNTKNCGDLTSLVVRCFRDSDHLFIGEYSVIDGNYTIPNLDANTTYDIVLVDKNRSIEQLVSSHRTPRLYTPINYMTKTIFSSLHLDFNFNNLIEWKVDGYYDICYIYRSLEPLTIENIPSDTYDYVTGVDGYLDYMNDADKKYYYLLKFVTPTNEYIEIIN